MASSSLTKAELRAEAKLRRAAEHDKRIARNGKLSAAASAWLLENPPAPGTVVVTYLALPGEPDLSALIHNGELASAGISFGYTRTPDDGYDLTVHPASSTLERHRFGFLQPEADADRLDVSKVAVVLVPGLGFDRFGNRLGFGAGYYDRFLARIGCEVMIGVADSLAPTRIPTDDHDVPMSHLLIPAGVIDAETDHRRQ